MVESQRRYCYRLSTIVWLLILLISFDEEKSIRTFEIGIPPLIRRNSILIIVGYFILRSTANSSKFHCVGIPVATKECEGGTLFGKSIDTSIEQSCDGQTPLSISRSNYSLESENRRKLFLSPTLEKPPYDRLILQTLLISLMMDNSDSTCSVEKFIRKGGNDERADVILGRSFATIFIR